MTRNRLRIIIWAAAVAAAASIGGYALRIDRQNRSILEYMEAGHMAEHCGDSRAAAANYKRALSLDAKYLPARIALADVHLSNGNEKRALETLRRGVVADANNADAYAAFAHALIECRHYPEAIRHLGRAVEIAPRDTSLRRLLAYCYRRHGDVAAANRQLTQIDKIAPDSPAASAARRALERSRKQLALQHRIKDQSGLRPARARP